MTLHQLLLWALRLMRRNRSFPCAFAFPLPSGEWTPPASWAILLTEPWPCQGDGFCLSPIKQEKWVPLWGWFIIITEPAWPENFVRQLTDSCHCCSQSEGHRALCQGCLQGSGEGGVPERGRLLALPLTFPRGEKILHATWAPKLCLPAAQLGSLLLLLLPLVSAPMQEAAFTSCWKSRRLGCSTVQNPATMGVAGGELGSPSLKAQLSGLLLASALSPFHKLSQGWCSWYVGIFLFFLPNL